MRVEQMAPLHPIEEATTYVAQRVEHLSELIETLGPRAAGPGHYAKGRAFLATNQLDAAIESLEAARRTGYESPRLLATLGLAYGQMYVRQRSAALKLPDPAYRKAALAAAREQWRDPASSLLADGQPSELVPREYLAALVSFYQEDDERALELAAEAVRKTAWFFEALVLRGEIFEGRAVEAMNSGAGVSLQHQVVRRAGDNYREARRIAPQQSWRRFRERVGSVRLR